MRGDNGLGDGQAHARSANLVALVPAPIKLIENEALFERINARALIGDAEGDEIARKLGGNGNGFLLWRI